MTDKIAIVWFREDLRIADNPALFQAREDGYKIVPCFILDDKTVTIGGASQWWLHHSLSSLHGALESIGARLILRKGEPEKCLIKLIKESEAKAVYWNRRYYEPQIDVDKSIKSRLEDRAIEVKTFNGSLLREPWEIETKTGNPYRVFTPFWKSLRKMGPARNEPFPKIRTVDGASADVETEYLDDWALLPSNPNWATGIAENWTPGEDGARDRLNDFLDGAINEYGDGRDCPAKELTSRLSPHLAFGEISPNIIWTETKSRMDSGEVNASQAEKFLSEIAWREFSKQLLFYNPTLPEKPLREEFSNYPWNNDQDGLRAWQRGETGYPIVDAGMRQLWKTGWMHNRVRMIVASFLIKDQLIKWQEGAAWFWDTLVDADIANNSASWQWVAGSGADASPYFRIFNPITQGEKFDPDGSYVREFVPELAEMPKKHIHAPWKAPGEVLEKAGVTLGETYPDPIVDHAEARKRALEGYDKVKSS